jgi:hypothetical protein
MNTTLLVKPITGLGIGITPTIPNPIINYGGNHNTTGLTLTIPNELEQ